MNRDHLISKKHELQGQIAAARRQLERLNQLPHTPPKGGVRGYFQRHRERRRRESLEQRLAELIGREYALRQSIDRASR